MKDTAIGRKLARDKKNREMDAQSYLRLVWVTKERESIELGQMKRSHVQNTLNWCIRKNAAPDETKDGIRYSQWISYCLARLLDPDLE